MRPRQQQFHRDSAFGASCIGPDGPVCHPRRGRRVLGPVLELLGRADRGPKWPFLRSNCPRIIVAKRSLALAAALTLVGLLPAPALAARWSDQLGYPPGKRVVILHAAELGVCYAANQSGQAGLESGSVTSAAVMVPCAWFGQMAQWARQHPDQDVGLALTMNSEGEHYRWGPVAPRTEVSSLVDADGFLWRRVDQTVVSASVEDVEREIEAQITRARIAGFRPGHFAMHLGALISRPDLTEVYLQAARRHWIPAVIIELTPDHVRQFREEGRPLSVDMIELIRHYPLPQVIVE